MNLEKKFLKKKTLVKLKRHLLFETMGFLNNKIRNYLFKFIKIKRFYLFLNEFIQRLIKFEKVTLKMKITKSILNTANIKQLVSILINVKCPVKLEIDLKLCYLSHLNPLFIGIGTMNSLRWLNLNLFLNNISDNEALLLSKYLIPLRLLTHINLNLRNNRR